MSKRDVSQRRMDAASKREASEVEVVVTTTRYHVKLGMGDLRQAEYRGEVSPNLLLHDNPEVLLGLDQLHQFVMQLIEGLPEIQRDILLRCCRDGCSEAEVAKELGLTRGKVRSLKKGALREAAKNKNKK